MFSLGLCSVISYERVFTSFPCALRPMKTFGGAAVMMGTEKAFKTSMFGGSLRIKWHAHVQIM